ncbi:MULTISPECIES: hypothetical protein [unclassified Butyrivibrio]|jgi:hypothetical protein|uniref:hypothetical protein n=1 Tax=unclassified Butyrivibrio TaxID=2639466 RepID=UPI0003B6B798|nr:MULTISPECIES: hypothetical protein [unclassified Butyrivibrio]MDC7295187.1 hypothetical protein [Butyrivibrio sp. DSM 10294]
MNGKSNTPKHLIDDNGVHHNMKHTHATIFILFCRLVTLFLIGIGLVALIVGNI